MVKKRERNKFHFQSFNDQLGGIKVGVRRLAKADDCEDNDTQTNQSLQYWREMNCSEQFVLCYGKLNTITESLPQLLHHKDTIVDIILDSLQDNTGRHGCDAVLDVLSHVALDLQQDFYSCVPRIVPVLHSLLKVQDAPLISHVFKTLAHIFKTTWRQMLADISSVFDLLSPLFKPPTKHYVANFTAESVAYLIRKHPEPEVLLGLLEEKIGQSSGLIAPVATLLFETVKGVQYKFNTHADLYLNLILKKSRTSKHFQNIYIEILKLVAIKITKPETQIIWDSLIRGLSTEKEPSEFLIFVLSCIDVMLKGGRHTYLISSSDLLSALTPIFSLLNGEEGGLEEKFSGTVVNFIRAHNHLMRYLKQMVSADDRLMLSLYLDHHKSVECLQSLISVLCGMPEFYDNYCPVILEKVQSFDLGTYLHVLAGISIHREAGNILEIPSIFAESRPEFKKSVVQLLSDSESDTTQTFQCLKVIQSFTNINDDSIASLANLFKALHQDKENQYLYLEVIKCLSLLSVDKSDGLLQWEEVVHLVTEQSDDVIVLQTVFFYLRQCGPGFIERSCFEKLMELLKDNLLKTSTSVRYITLNILSLYTEVEEISPTTRQDITAALSAESTPLTLETYRDRLMHCSLLRYSASTENTDFRVRYLLGSLQWPLRPIWEGLTKLIVEFGNADSATFWTIFSQVMGRLYDHTSNGETKMEIEYPTSDYVRKIATSNFSNSGLLVKDIDDDTFRNCLWNLLSEVPHIAEPKSRYLVPIILEFRVRYNEVYGFRKQDISLNRIVKASGGSKPETHINDELRAMLKLLSQFNNPKALYKTDELQNMYSELLSNKQTDVQKLALECMITYKDPSLTEYKEDILMLVDDVNFRDQLAKFSVSGEGTILKPDHRAAVFPILLKIMFGKMGSRIGHAKGKAGSKQRQGIVLRYLEACSEEEIGLFFDLVALTFGINEINPDSSPSFSITPLGMQTSYLRLIRQTISVLHEDQTRPHIPHIIDTVLTMLHSVQHCLQRRTEVMPHTHTPLKALRALTISTITHVLNAFPVDDLTAHQARVYEVVVDVNIGNLPAESLQSSSPLLLLIESCAMHRLSWLQHTCAGKHVLEYVISLLRGKGVVSVVISKVLTIIACLLDHGTAGQTLLLPYLNPVVQYIHQSLLSLKKTKKKKHGPAVSVKKTLKQELDLLSRISCLITEIPDMSLQTSCDALINTLVHVLKEQIVRKPVDVVNAVDTITQLLVCLKKTEHSEYPGLLDTCYQMCCVLFGDNNDKDARKSLCRLLENTGHPSANILHQLHAWNMKVLDEPDFDARLQGFRDMSLILNSDVPVSDLKLRLSPCLNTALYTVFTSEEMALRDSASHAAILTIDFVKTTSNSQIYTLIIEEHIVKFLHSGLRNPAEVFQREAILLLHKVVQAFPEVAPWNHLAPLTDEDPEIDFFNNITHIQTHRRTRAVTRMKGSIEKANVDSMWNYLLPILSPVFSLSGNKHHNTITEGLSVLTEMCLKFPWAKFLKLLQKSLKDLAAKVEDKITVKVVGAILAGFHEPVEPGSKILSTITKQVLPKMQEFLTKVTTAPIERSKKKSIAYEEDQVAVQAPIAISIVNLITRLPAEERQTKLPPVLLRICNTLRNRAMDVRDVSRQTLSTIANSLGPLYLGYILSELRGALSKGYQLHVLSFTMHHLLLHTELKPADIDNSTLQTITEICVDGLVGRTAADRDRGHDKKNTLPEAKKCYSSQCLEMCATVVAVSQLELLMEPVKRMVLETRRSKTIIKLEDLLKCMVSGLFKNPLITPTVSMVFCYRLLNDSIAIEKTRRTSGLIAPEKTDIYEIPDAPKRDGVKPKLIKTSNIHLLHQFSLQILSTLLKRGVVTAKEHGELLDPFIGSLTECLASSDVKTQVLAVRCFSQLFEQNVLLPRLCENVTELTKFSFHVLRNNSRSTNSGHMLELIFSSFKILTVILREYKDYSLSELEVKTLLQYIADDIHNRNRQATAFSLLKSILTRDIVLPEIPELLERVFEMSVVGQSDFVRTQSRQVFLHYLLHYPLGKKLRNYVVSLTKQLEYTHKDGRMSALELLGMLVSKLPPALLKEYFLVVFLSLSTMLVSDEDAECRKGAGITVSDLVSRAGNDNLREKVWSLTAAWLADKKLKHKYLAVLLMDSLSKHLSTKRAAVLIEQLVGVVNTFSVWEGEEDNATSTRDQIVYTGVLTLLKLSNMSPLPISVYDRLQEVMSYPHQWVRLAGSQLLGHLLSGHNCRTVLTAASSSQILGDNPRQKVDELIKLCLLQLKSTNVLPDHALQIVKNVVWLTSALLFSPDDNTEEGLLSTHDLIYRLVVVASIESSQDPTNTLKRGIILKWVGAVVNTVDKEVLAPHLPSLVAPVHREVKNTTGPACDMATEVMSFLRDRLGNETLSQALITADKTRSEKKRKRKRETALAAIANPESHAKKKVKVNLAKREKRKEKYKKLKAKQFKSH